MMLRPMSMQRSPLTEPASASAGLVAPTILRPLTIAFLPSQTYIPPITQHHNELQRRDVVGVATDTHHGDDGAGGEVVDQAGEEGLLGQVLVVLLSKLLGGPDDLDANELVALLLEALDDLANDATLDTVGLDGNEGPLEPGAGQTSVGHLVVSLD
jgi:hypothetical protein